MNSKAIHISDVRTFRSCRRRWDWSSPMRRGLEPSIPYVPFFTGKALHAALEYYYKDGVPLDDTVDKYVASEQEAMREIGELWPEEVQVFEEQIDLIRMLIYHYKLWQAQDTRKYSDRNLEFINLELPFVVPLPTPDGSPHPTLMLEGRFDGIVKHKDTNTLWIWETKTTRSVAELSRSLANDEQATVYMYAARTMGMPVVGVLYNMIRKKEPAYPKTLQSGKLSLAANIDTTAFYYLVAIRETQPELSNEEIEEQYGPFLAALLENESKFFTRYPVYRSDAELDIVMKNIYHTAMEMTNPDIVTYPAPSWLNCNFCSYRSPCLTMNAGGNYEVLLEEEYKVREHNVSMRPDIETED